LSIVVIVLFDGFLMERSTSHVHQLLGVHVVEDALSVFAVASTLHDGQQQFGRVVLEFQDQIHPGLSQRIDVGQQKGRDDVQPVGLVRDDAILIFVAGALAVLDQRLQRLVDETDVVLVDVQTQEAQFTGGGTANAVEEHQRLRDQVVAVLVRLHSQEILEQEKSAVR
jgi:hypothetical protein